MIPERIEKLPAADGVELEARVAVPGGARAGIVVCHPHPLYGGDLDNPVVVRAVEVASELGLATCRFNFRGVGASGGTHDQGRAERLDVQAGLDHLHAVLGDGARLVLAGYSFGASVAAQVAASGRTLSGLALIGPPLAMTGDGPFAGLASLDLPTLVVAGSRDEYCPEASLRGLRERLRRGTVAVVDGADHFFFGKLYPLGERLREWLGTLEPGQAGRRGGSA